MQKNKQMKVAALVSGGVDSSVMVHLLKKQGVTPDIFYIKIGIKEEAGYVCPKEEDIEITEYIAKKYACKMEVVDLEDAYYDSVIKYTLDTVRKGFTPNPDVMCNLLIKFGAFNDKWGYLYDRIATGHYAGIQTIRGENFLRTAKDTHKDQTYFLGRITHAQLQKAMFPLQDISKPDVRKIALEANLPSAARPDSQGICFLGKINYSDFIKQHVGERPGPVIELETGKQWGEHRGLWFHTIGQRKGLGLSQGPWFVVKKDIPNNVLYISHGYDPQAQYGSIVQLDDFRFINEKADLDYSTPQAIRFKIRHSPEFLTGTMQQTADDSMIIASDRPIAGIAPGQFGVIYQAKGELCMGAGIISEQTTAI